MLWSAFFVTVGWYIQLVRVWNKKNIALSLTCPLFKNSEFLDETTLFKNSGIFGHAQCLKIPEFMGTTPLTLQGENDIVGEHFLAVYNKNIQIASHMQVDEETEI